MPPPPVFVPADYVDCCGCIDPYTPIKKVLFVSWGPWSGDCTWDGSHWVGEQDVTMAVFTPNPTTGYCESSGSGSVRVRITLGCISGQNFLTKCWYGGMLATVEVNSCGPERLSALCLPLVPAAGSDDLSLAYTSVIAATQEGTGVDEMSCDPGPVAGEMRMRGYNFTGGPLWAYSGLPWGGSPGGDDCSTDGMPATADNLTFSE